MFNRSRRNLAQWFTLSMGSILLVFTAVIYYQKVTDTLRSLDQLLYNKARVMAASVDYEIYQGQKTVNLDRVPLLGNSLPPPDSTVFYVRWYDASGELKQFSGAPPPKQLEETFEFETVETIETASESPQKPLWLRQVTLPVQHKGTLIGYLQVAIPMTEAQRSLKNFLFLLALVVPLTLGLIALVGWWLSGLAMQPIQRAYDQLQRFSANASHELRAPLAAILSNAQVGMLSRSDDSARHRQRFEKIADLTKSMSTLINNLLFLARQTGRLSPDCLQEVDLKSLLKDLITTFVVHAEAQQVHLVSELEQVVMLRAEPTLLSQAIGNLLRNAINYTPAGGKVTLRMFAHSTIAVIQVEDTGIGIAEAHLPHIFEHFYRVDQDRSKETGGVGLGLAIVQQIVEAHKGNINVASTPGKGSLFQIEIPFE